jgi:hypothetical protein
MLGARTVLYQPSEGLTGMRAGLAWRLRAKSTRYQWSIGQPMRQDFGPLALLGDRAPARRRTLRVPLERVCATSVASA